MKKDYLIKFMTRSGSLRGTAAIVTETLRELVRRHDLWPTAAVALGRSVAGCACMAGLLKDDASRISLKFEGDGPLRKILVEGGHDGTLRGAVGDAHVELKPEEGRLDVAGALGRVGTLTVIRDPGHGPPYTGKVPLVSGEIGEDLAWYLADSEQIPSAVSVGVGVDSTGIAAAGGFILQSLPPVDEAAIEQVMRRLETLPPLSGLLAAGETPEMLVARILADLPYEILEIRPLRFGCTCSRARIESLLLSLGVAEIRRMAQEMETTEVTCEFCREHYAFTALELQALVAQTGPPRGSA
ncbi:MAG: Hsp33 family molecular chaperone HslO [Deltaproteobacteria bacterium HGW-Deltaproteobacteria-22]|nr:MAG: Hsp33 family molecular chaperone HslO [Deltaproteobacteria bacterium HGW-Deltaproteobacteria-22]